MWKPLLRLLHDSMTAEPIAKPNNSREPRTIVHILYLYLVNDRYVGLREYGRFQVTDSLHVILEREQAVARQVRKAPSDPDHHSPPGKAMYEGLHSGDTQDTAADMAHRATLTRQMRPNLNLWVCPYAEWPSVCPPSPPLAQFPWGEQQLARHQFSRLLEHMSQDISQVSGGGGWERWNLASNAGTRLESERARNALMLHSLFSEISQCFYSWYNSGCCVCIEVVCSCNLSTSILRLATAARLLEGCPGKSWCLE